MTITIPVVVLSLTLGACVWTGCGSSKSKPAQTTVVVQTKLSDSYATSALFALKAIQRDTYVPAKGSQLVSRSTQEKIDAADIAAVSNEERNLTSELNAVYHAQLNLNQHKEELKQDSQRFFGIDAPQHTKKQWDVIAKVLTEKSNENKTIGKQLDTCFSDFDASLRARSTNVPASCAADLGATDAVAAALKQGK